MGRRALGAWRMTDDRFFQRRGPFSLGTLAEHAKAELSSDAPRDLMIRGIAALDIAEPDELSVFCDARLTDAFAASRACAIVTSSKLSNHPHNGSWLLVARDPRQAFAVIGLMFYPRDITPGVNAAAQVDPSAVIGDGCQIDCGVVVGPHARLGAGCHIASNAVIGPSVEVGDGSTVGSNATITHALIGSRVRVGSGAVIGGEGFGVVLGPRGLLCSAQIGRVIIGDDVRVGGNCTIDRGAVGDTVIGAGTMLDNQVQIAHNVQIGRNCIFAGQSGVAGSTTIGDNVMVGGQVAICDHLTVGSNVRIAGKSGVMRDIGDGETVAGYPAVAVRQWHRQTVAMARASRKLPEA
jgi:UDP-3-O-[3-hydroxymyristoyl] glucosamine N-acyltransferase